jgi:antitoxin MazE
VKAKIQKWGNSLGIRIPRIVAQETSVESDSIVDISIQDGKIIISPEKRKSLSLRQLLSKITKANIHEEIAAGDPIGREIW